MNKNWKKRDEIIGVQEKKYSGGIVSFEGLSLETLEKMVKNNFIDLDDAQNEAPSAGEILEFMKANPRFTCHGYAVSIERSDYAVMLEGVELNEKPTQLEKDNFVEMF